MRLTKEHIGKKVRWTGWNNGLIGILKGIDGTSAWIRFPEGNHDTHNTEDGSNYFWEIVEPKKKPSEIIYAKLAGTIFISSNTISPSVDSTEYANRRIDMILDFLDEQSEKGEK